MSDTHATGVTAAAKPAATIPSDRVVPAHGVSFGEAFKVWLRVALLSFGGPAGQIAVMHRIVVEERRWISEARFLHALNYCHLLPGPEAQQLAIYIGWLMHRTRGGLVAGVHLGSLIKSGSSVCAAASINWPRIRVPQVSLHDR